MSRWADCTDRRPCHGDTCAACIERRSAARRAIEERHYHMSERPGASPLFLLSAYTLRNGLIGWLARRGALSDERVRYRLQATDFGDSYSEDVAVAVFDARIEHDPRKFELR